MLVILKENVDHLGTVGDVVKVSDGYARNFLLPRNLVLAANENNLAQVEHHKKALEKKRIGNLKDASELKAKLEELSLTVFRKVGAKDKLFGSVSASDVAEALEKLGIKVEKRKIQFKDQVKALGSYKVAIRLLPDVTATVKLTVSKEAE